MFSPVRTTLTLAHRLAAHRLLRAGMFACSALLLTSQANAVETYKAGSPPTSAPMTFLDVPTNTIQGVMPDIIREIGKREGFAIDFQAIQFPALIQSAVSGKIDIIVSAMSPTPKRAEVVDFADEVYAFGEAVALPDSDKTPYTDASEFKGKTIGTMAGTTYGDSLKKMGGFKDIKYYDTTADMLTDLRSGRIVAAFDDAPIYAGLELKGGLKGLHVDTAYKPMERGGIAIAVRKGNKPLLDKINAGVASIKADGTLTKILAKWKMQ